MSIVQQEDELKGVPDDRLVAEMQNPSGMFPAYLVFTEINRREELRSRFADEQARMPTTSMAEEAVAQMMNGGMPMEQPMEQGLGQGMPQDMQGMPPGMGQGMPPGMPPGMDQGMPPMPPGMDQGIASGPPMQMMSNGGMVRGFANGSDGAVSRRRSGRDAFGRNSWMAIQEQLNNLQSLGVPEDDSRYIALQEKADAARAEGNKPTEDEPWFGGFFKRGQDKAREEALAEVSSEFTDIPKVNVGEAKQYRGPTVGDINQATSRAFGDMYPEAPAVPATGAGAGPPASEVDPLEALRKQAAGMDDAYKTDPNADADMQDLEDRLAKLNPAPDRRNLLAQSMMQIGSGLMQSPTWQGGLGKGFDQVSQTVGKYGDDVRAYNQGRSITEQALYEADRARADKYRETQFRDRKTGFESALSIAGLEQRGRIADQTDKRMVGNSELNRIKDQIIAIQKVPTIGLSTEQLRAREESLKRLEEQERRVRGGARLTRGPVEGIPG
jgi:hypothetical protein